MFEKQQVNSPTPNTVKDVGEEKDAINNVSDALDAPELTSFFTEKRLSPTEKTEGENNGEVDFGAVMEKIGGATSEQSAISGIMELTHSDTEKDDDKDLGMKADIFHAGSFTAAQWLANFNDDLGMPEVGEAMRNLCDWHYIHNSALKGRGKLNRAEQAFAALKEEIAKEFQLKKEVKAIMP